MEKITLSEEAAAAIQELLRKEDMSDRALRIFLAGSG